MRSRDIPQNPSITRTTQLFETERETASDRMGDSLKVLSDAEAASLKKIQSRIETATTNNNQGAET